jgi:ATP phosphoribosyltransferase
VTSRKTPQTLGVPNRGRLRSYVVSLLSGVAEIDRDRSLIWDKGEAFRVIAAHSRDLPKLFLAGVCDYILTGLDYAVELGLPGSPSHVCPPARAESRPSLLASVLSRENPQSSLSIQT